MGFARRGSRPELHRRRRQWQHDGCTLAPSSLPHSATAMQSEEGGAAATSAWDADFDHETMQAIKLSLETIAYCDEKGPRAATLPSLQRVMTMGRSQSQRRRSIPSAAAWR